MKSKEELYEEIATELRLLKDCRTKIEQHLEDMILIKKLVKIHGEGLNLLAENVLKNKDDLICINKHIEKGKHRRMLDDVMFS